MGDSEIVFQKASILGLLAFSFLQGEFNLLQDLTEYLLIIVSKHHPLKNFHGLVSFYTTVPFIITFTRYCSEDTLFTSVPPCIYIYHTFTHTSFLNSRLSFVRERT